MEKHKRKILRSDKHVFWEALVIAIFIFGLGILLGIFIENSRAVEISEMYLKSEINLLDVKVQTEILNLEDINCEQAIVKNIEFGDKIYEDAKKLKDYEDASRISESLKEQHRRYDLLRTLFWINSIKIREKCKEQEFYTVVYLYNYGSEDIEELSKQQVFSRFLEEIKQEKGDNVALIPIARNLDLASLDILTSNYGINQTSVILNEGLVVTDVNKIYQIKAELNIISNN